MLEAIGKVGGIPVNSLVLTTGDVAISVMADYLPLTLNGILSGIMGHIVL